MVNDIAELRHSGIVLEQISAPTLVIHGTRDFQVPIASALTHATKIANAELLVVENATHFAFATHRDEVAEAIHTFIRKVVRQTEAGAPDEQDAETKNRLEKR